MATTFKRLNITGSIRASSLNPPPISSGLIMNLDASNREYNDGRNWAAGWSGTFINPAASFDGNLSTATGGPGGTFSATYTFAGGLAVSGTVRLYVALGATSGQVGGATNIIIVNGNDISSKMKSAGLYLTAGWVDVTTEVGSTFNTIVLNGTNSVANPLLYAVEVGGVILSNNIWPDLSGNGNNGTLVNNPVYNSGNQGYFTFNGINNYVDTLNASTIANLTVEMWLYDNRSSGQRDILTYNGNSGSYTYNGSTFRTDGNDLVGRTFANVGQPPSNQWYRFCYVKNGDLYINQTKYIGSGSDRAYGLLSFANTRSDINNRLNGRIAVIKVYNRNLTAEEISQNYESLRSRFGL